MNPKGGLMIRAHVRTPPSGISCLRDVEGAHALEARNDFSAGRSIGGAQTNLLLEILGGRALCVYKPILSSPRLPMKTSYGP